MPDTIDIFIRSYHRDQRWLVQLLTSIEQYVTGFRQVVVVVPKSSLPRMNLTLFEEQSRVRLLICRDYDLDYLGQQVTKLHADRYSNADVIVHIDSDQVFQRPCDLGDVLFAGDCLRIVRDGSGIRPASDGWRCCPTEFFRVPVAFDLTTPLPLALRRAVYPEVRRLCWRGHGVSLSRYVMSRPADRMCELALLRGCALLNNHPGYKWLDHAAGDLLPAVRTFWSRAETPDGVSG